MLNSLVAGSELWEGWSLGCWQFQSLLCQLFGVHLWIFLGVPVGPFSASSLPGKAKRVYPEGAGRASVQHEQHERMWCILLMHMFFSMWHELFPSNFHSVLGFKSIFTDQWKLTFPESCSRLLPLSRGIGVVPAGVNVQDCHMIKLGSHPKPGHEAWPVAWAQILIFRLGI